MTFEVFYNYSQHTQILLVCSIPCINMNFIHIYNANKCTYKSTYNLYCLFSPTCFGHTLTIFRAHILVTRVHLKMCSSPDCPTAYIIPFDNGIFKLLNCLTIYLEWTGVQNYDVLTIIWTTTHFKMYSCY